MEAIIAVWAAICYPQHAWSYADLHDVRGLYVNEAKKLVSSICMKWDIERYESTYVEYIECVWVVPEYKKYPSVNATQPISTTKC